MESSYSDSDGEEVSSDSVSEVEGGHEVVEPQDAGDFLWELEEEKKVQTSATYILTSWWQWWWDISHALIFLKLLVLCIKFCHVYCVHNFFLDSLQGYFWDPTFYLCVGH